MKNLFIIVLLALSFNAFTQIPTNGLVAYYPFSGNANDMSGNGYNGILNGPTLTSDRFGNPNSAYGFDGVNDYIILNNYVTNFNFQQPASISLWVETKYDIPQTVYSLGDGTTQTYFSGISIGNNTTGTLTNELIIAGSQVTGSDKYITGFETTNRDLLINTGWHHLVVLFDNVSTKIYLDNTLLPLNCTWGINNGHYGNLTIAGSMIFGARYANGYGGFLNGSLDDIRVYNGVLTPTEITALYQETFCTAPIPLANNVSLCGGGVAPLTASGGTSYIWYNSSHIQIASGPTFTTPFLMATTTYFVTNFDGTCESLPDTVVVTVNPLPTVTINPINDFININSTPVNLSGTPLGGVFWGNGIAGNLFNATNTGLGTTVISYSYTDGNGCSKTVNKSVIVYDTLGTVCVDTILISVTDTLIIDVLLSIIPPDNINTIKIYPNPTQDFVIIHTGSYLSMANYTIKIENSLGQTVFQNLIDQQLFQISINDFGSYGLYYVKIIDDIGNIVTTRKIILQ